MYQQRKFHLGREPKALPHIFKSVSFVAWCTCVAVSVFFTIQGIEDSSTRRVWDQNYLHPTNFTINHLMGNIFWLGLFVLQLGYFIGHLVHNPHDVYFDANVDFHFIGNNLFHVAFVFLFIRSLFVWAEVILLLNFINLTTLYFRHDLYSRFGTYPKILLMPVMSLPLAWNFVAIYWNGAMVIPQDNQAAPIVGYVFVWGILAYGGLHIHYYKDYAMSLGLSFLAAAIGVAQLRLRVIPVQWVFPFVIMAVLFAMAIFAAAVQLNERKERVQRESLADKWPKALESGLSSATEHQCTEKQ